MPRVLKPESSAQRSESCHSCKLVLSGLAEGMKCLDFRPQHQRYFFNQHSITRCLAEWPLPYMLYCDLPLFLSSLSPIVEIRTSPLAIQWEVWGWVQFSAFISLGSMTCKEREQHNMRVIPACKTHPAGSSDCIWKPARTTYIKVLAKFFSLPHGALASQLSYCALATEIAHHHIVV